MTARAAISVVAVISAGSMAGLLFGWMVSVLPGLSRLDDRTYVSTMRSINVRIINPMFLVPFMGTPVVLAAAALLMLRAGEQRRAWVLFGAAATYVVGVLMVTGVGNVPLNDRLDAFELDRADYETPWNRWHLARTIASAFAFVLATSSLLVTETE